MENCFEISGTQMRIRVPKELDHHNAEYIRKEADRLLGDRNIRSIVFDFKDTVFMDSAGIGLIMGRYKKIRCIGGKLTAVRANEHVRRILTLSGLYKVIEIQTQEPERGKIR